MSEPGQPPPTGQFHSGAAALVGTGGLTSEAFNQVEEALRKLRPQVQAALIDNAEAALKVVRDDPTSSPKRHGLIMAILEVFKAVATKILVEEAQQGFVRLVQFLSEHL
jgi:hypothetical protein